MSRSMIPHDSRERCFICKKTGNLQVHHMLHGCRRAAADKYGLTVHLCAECHGKLHDKGVYDAEIEEIAQMEFEKVYGHDEFMRIFQKNFINNEEENR